MKQIYAVLILFFIITQVGCQHDKNEVITNKIQYDVLIKSPDPEYDWWIQNLVGPERERLVEIIIEGAKSGKFDAYDYYNEPIDKYEVQALFSDTMFVEMMREVPPYELFDTIVVYNIYPKDIVKLRFMEEWSMNPENLHFEKRVYGLAPIARRFDSNGIERWQPLFWIYIDEDFKKSLERTNK